MLGCLILGGSFLYLGINIQEVPNISILKEEIKKKKENDFRDIDPDNLKLWKVDIPAGDNRLKQLMSNAEIDIDSISKDLGGAMFLDPMLNIARYFPETYNPPEEHVHILVQPPPPPVTTGSGQLKSLKTVKEIIEMIKKEARKKHNTSESPDKIYMPLQQRNFELAIDKISQTTNANVDEMEGYSNYWCLVSAGAPGIGKTRFGKELFEYVKQNWQSPQIWADVHFEYLYMNFGIDLQLDVYDSDLPATVIFGLRIAFAFFIEDDYDMTFQVFRSKALLYAKGNDIFIAESVIDCCYESLKLYNNQKLFLYLHIDEFQVIDAWDPFLSGTAPQAVAAKKEASNISFYTVDCPLLDNASMIRIMDYFATKYEAQTYPNRVYKWKLCAPIIQLLMDTGGLPRALERLLIICFKKLCDGKTFFQEIESHNYDNIYTDVKGDLQRMYNIYDDVKRNPFLHKKLLYYCVEGIPVADTLCLDEKNPGLTIENLQRDGHIVLSPCDCGSFIKMPFFFIHIYNDILKIVCEKLTNKAFQVNQHMYWQEWELFVLHHETFRTNLAIEMGITDMTLGQLYPGAYGSDDYLQLIHINLKKLSICEANEQFPATKKLTSKPDKKPIDLESGDVIVLNGASSKFSDSIILVRMNGIKYLFMLQCKWDYGSRDMTEKEAVDDEDIKNLDALISNVKNMYEGYELITVIFTTQPYDGLKEKTGVLIVSKDNFDKHFGPVFSSQAIFSFTKAINPNFWDIDRLKNTLEGIDEASIDDVISKRPYINEDQFYDANPRAKKQKLVFFPLDVPETEIYAPNQ
ncbi:hypothetical protein RhiirB3_447640 [Rhizophagus irregularis]|nr:hypothetical protein RhiirB3_447640 [Rhizophagus irregularis]